MAFRRYNNFKKKRHDSKRLPGTAVMVENGNIDKAIRKLKKKLEKENSLKQEMKREEKK